MCVAEGRRQVHEQIDPLGLDRVSRLGRDAVGQLGEHRGDRPKSDVPDVGVCGGDEGCLAFHQQAGPREAIFPRAAVGEALPAIEPVSTDDLQNARTELVVMGGKRIAGHRIEFDLQDDSPVGLRDATQFVQKPGDVVDPLGRVAIDGLERVVIKGQRLIAVVPNENIIKIKPCRLGQQRRLQIQTYREFRLRRLDDSRPIVVVAAVEHVLGRPVLRGIHRHGVKDIK